MFPVQPGDVGTFSCRKCLLLRIIWMFTIFARIHTLPALCWCYAVSWVVTGVSMFLYFRKGSWLDRGSMIVDK